MNKLSAFFDRLGEPSSWNAITIPLILFGVLDQEGAAVIAQAGSEIVANTKGSAIDFNFGIIGGAITSIIAFFMKEKSN